MDPVDGGTSLTNVRELIFACLEAAGVESLLEIGAFEGELTAELLDWGGSRGATIATIDPVPPEELLELAAARPELVLHERTSHEVLAGLGSLPDAIVIDGDHNYFTLREELRLIGERAGSRQLPLVLFHDVGWPHAHRDTYYAHERIPIEQRPEIGIEVGIAPGNPGTDGRGLPYPAAALREGGPRNGTVPAIEDFCADRGGLRFAIVPAFFGLGVVWQEDAPWGAEVGRILEPYDRNPLVERLEWNRVEHLVAGHARSLMLRDLLERTARQEAMLRKLLDSRAFAMAERVTRIYQRGGEPAFTREQVERALDPRSGPTP